MPEKIPTTDRCSKKGRNIPRNAEVWRWRNQEIL